MLEHVPVPPKSLGDYSAIVGAEVVQALRERAAPYRGARILHVNSTAFGGGVAELLYTQVPLYRDLGIEAEWRLIEGNEQFFGVTKAIHNALQGAEVEWTREMEQIYMDTVEENAKAFDGKYDFVIIHDPQPAAMLNIIEDHTGRPAGKWIWRCHIDLTTRFEPVWEFLQPHVGRHDAAIFTMQDFVPPGLQVPRLELIPPSIDPLSLKNISLDQETVEAVMQRYGIDVDKPLAVQVSRFDPWKDPLGVIDAYRIAKREIPDLQLAMIASMASDDPEGMHYFAMTDDHRAEDPDIWLLSNLQEVGALAVNAFQRAASVVVQKSLREGFGLVVAEGMWKRKPVVAGNVGGIRLQIEDGQTGYLVDTVEACAAAMVKAIQDPEGAESMGTAARARVRQHFLSTRSIGDYLKLFDSLSLA